MLNWMGGECLDRFGLVYGLVKFRSVAEILCLNESIGSSLISIVVVEMFQV